VPGERAEEQQLVADALQIESITGVDLELPIAGPGGRSYAFVIDWHIRLLLALAWYVVGTLLFFGGLAVVDAGSAAFTRYLFAVVLPASAVYFLYHPVLEIAMHGRTPGKRMAGVRIVTQTGEVPGIGAILIRNVLRIVDSLPALYVVGLVATLLTDQSVRIGDMAAGTLLVYDEDQEKDAFAQVNSAAVAAIGLENLQLLDDLLARWPDLDPVTRHDLGRKMLQRLGRDAPPTDDAVLETLRGIRHPAD
jgi:uncharacterized RDD family membrane protein YckC